MKLPIAKQILIGSLALSSISASATVLIPYGESYSYDGEELLFDFFVEVSSPDPEGRNLHVSAVFSIEKNGSGLRGREKYVPVHQGQLGVVKDGEHVTYRVRKSEIADFEQLCRDSRTFQIRIWDRGAQGGLGKTRLLSCDDHSFSVLCRAYPPRRW